MPAPANLVHQTSTTTGTGNLTLAAVNGKQSFSNAFGTGGSDVFDYFISNQDASEWERGTGSMSDATTLVRDTVIESTNSDAAVNFSAGTKDVTNGVPAGNQITSEDIGVSVQAFDADTLKADVGDTLTAGYLTDSYSGGTQSGAGTYTPAPGTGQENIQHIVNGGAFTLAPPASPCTVIVQIINNGSAGTVTTSGFDIVDGDSFDTTDTNAFMCFIAVTNDYSYLNVKAMQ